MVVKSKGNPLIYGNSRLVKYDFIRPDLFKVILPLYHGKSPLKPEDFWNFFASKKQLQVQTASFEPFGGEASLVS